MRWDQNEDMSLDQPATEIEIAEVIDCISTMSGKPAPIAMVVRRLAFERDRLREYQARLDAWQAELEKRVSENPESSAFVFSLGEWWGRRPWRKETA